MSNYEEKPTTPLGINFIELKRKGGMATQTFNETTTITPELSETIRKATELLDMYRIKVLFSSMDKGNVTQEFANKTRDARMLLGYKSMTPNIETNAATMLDAIKPEHKGRALAVELRTKRNYTADKFNSIHSMARLANSLELCKLLGPDQDTVTDIVFVYTEDGVESMMEYKEKYGTTAGFGERYPQYWSLYKIFNLSGLFGFKVINLGKDGAIIGLDEFLSTNFDVSKSPQAEILPVDSYIKSIAPFNKDVYTIPQNSETVARNEEGPITHSSGLDEPQKAYESNVPRNVTQAPSINPNDGPY